MTTVWMWSGLALALFRFGANPWERLRWMARSRWPPAAAGTGPHPPAGMGTAGLSRLAGLSRFPGLSGRSRPTALDRHLRRGRRRLPARELESLLDALAAVVDDLVSGATAEAALAGAGRAVPLQAPAFLAAAELAGQGDDPAPAFRVERVGYPAVAATLSVVHRTGAPLVPSLLALSAQLRDELDTMSAVAGSLAGPRASAFLLAGLPLLGVAMGTALGARPAAYLLGSDTGRIVLVAGLALDAVGLGWISALARSAIRGPARRRA